MTEMDLTETNMARTRRNRMQTRLAKYVREGREFVTVIAHEQTWILPDRVTGSDVSADPPYVQFAWRDDLRLQVEIQGDTYRGEPYSAIQRRMMLRLGYVEPFELGPDFGNWILFREGEGCHPDSVASLMIDSMRQVFGAHFHDIQCCLSHGMTHWQYEWSVSPGKRDIEGEFRSRFTSN